MDLVFQGQIILFFWLYGSLVNSDMQGTNIMPIYQCSIQRERCITIRINRIYIQVTIRIPKSKKVPALVLTNSEHFEKQLLKN
jgi:hypothetical protein